MHLAYVDKDVNVSQSCLNEDLLNISKWLMASKLTINMTLYDYINRLETKAKRPNCLSRSEHQWYSRKPGINAKNL